MVQPFSLYIIFTYPVLCVFLVPSPVFLSVYVPTYRQPLLHNTQWCSCYAFQWQTSRCLQFPTTSHCSEFPVLVLLWTFVSSYLGYFSKSRIARSQGMFRLKLNKQCKIATQNSCTKLICTLSRVQSVSVSPHPRNTWRYSDFLSLRVFSYKIISHCFICTTSYFEHFFICLLAFGESYKLF